MVCYGNNIEEAYLVLFVVYFSLVHVYVVVFEDVVCFFRCGGEPYDFFEKRVERDTQREVVASRIWLRYECSCLSGLAPGLW
mgnify:CR=1 FL=1